MKHRTSAAFLLTQAIAAAATAQSGSEARPGDANIMDTTMQVTGAVVSADANRLVVRNDKGEEMVFLVTDKQVSASQFSVGDRVTASYTTLAGTGAVVSKVVSAPVPMTTTVSTYTLPAVESRTPTAAEPDSAPAPAASKRPMGASDSAQVPATEPLPARTLGNDAEPPAATLPATAGPLPLVALIGLLGAGGAAAIRRFRQS